MRYLVDSDRIIDWLKGRPDAVTLLAQMRPDGLGVSVISFGEVYEGIYYGPDPLLHEQQLLRFLNQVTVLDVTSNTARIFARIRGDLRARRLLIPEPDLLIAATALEHDLTPVTRNLRHFERIPDLRIYRAT